MFNAETLNFIQQQSTLHQKNIVEMLSNIDNMAPGSVPIVALPQHVGIHSLEKYLPHPVRFRGTFSTHYIEQFSKYVIDNNRADIFIDPDRMTAKAVFDLGTPDAPGNEEHKATITLKKTAPFVAMLEAIREVFTQRALAEWLEQWRAYLTPLIEITFEGEKVKHAGGIAGAIAAVRTIDIKETLTRGSVQNNFSAEKSMLESVEVSSKLEMPAFFVFSTEPHFGLSKRDFLFRLTITNGDTPKLRLQAMNYELMTEEMALEFADIIDALLSESESTVRVGNFE